MEYGLVYVQRGRDRSLRPWPFLPVSPAGPRRRTEPTGTPAAHPCFSAALCDFFSRAVWRRHDRLALSPAGIAITVVLAQGESLHETETWQRLAGEHIDRMVSQAFVQPNDLIQILDLIPTTDTFGPSTFGAALRHLRVPDDVDSKTRRRLTRAINTKLKTGVKDD